MGAESKAIRRGDHRAATELGNGDTAVEIIVVDLDIAVVFKRKFDGEADAHRIVVDAAVAGEAAFEAEEIARVAGGFCDAVIPKRGRLGEGDEDRAAILPGGAGGAPSGIKECVIVDAAPVHAKGAHAAPEEAFQSQVMEVQTVTVIAIHRTVVLGRGEGEVADAHFRGIIAEVDEVGAAEHRNVVHWIIRQASEAGAPCGHRCEDSLTSACSGEGHAGLGLERRGQSIGAR